MQTDIVHPESFLAYIGREDALVTSEGKELPRSIPFTHWDELAGKNMTTTAILASVDNGNDAFKGAMLHATQPVMSTRRIVTAYAPARILRAGEGMTTWQVNNSEPFWIGEEALLSGKAESLPIGMTDERVSDERYRHYLFTCLVELLREAGYEKAMQEWQGEYDLYVSFGVPNEEVTRNGLNETTNRALQHIFHTPFRVCRTDEQGHSTIWHLHLVELNPYPQTFGSFLTWYYAINGTAIETDIVKHVTLDIGGGQFHTCTVNIDYQPNGKAKLRMEAALLDEGTIAIARAVRESLRARYSGVRLSDVEAQQVLLSQQVTIGGRRTRIEPIIDDIVRTRSSKLLTHMRHLLQEDQTFLMFTGGGSILLQRSLYELVSAKRTDQSFFFVPKRMASVLNAIGGYVLAQATAQRRMQRATAVEAQR
ncbi:hypothetical protein [Ktedonobacter robiniae]|uniref:Actin-like protein N-terminal domain-containing protein n=1 Tax=Ktedonobacter robiniae TaxID=2778365 RepID=A0ABQ3V3W9_9CHLR|nr:hypothetical protein [Ktedonobacter robiniae]GHO59170.1 hypothetical protein KSB_76450 [Ktedonobacter robiniae]